MKNVHYMPVKVKGSRLLAAAAVKMSTSPSPRGERRGEGGGASVFVWLQLGR